MASINSLLTYNEEYTYKHEYCYHCRGYYGPCFGEPLCATCHAFLFPSNPFKSYQALQLCDQKADECDSGNEEPRDSQQDCVPQRADDDMYQCYAAQADTPPPPHHEPLPHYDAATSNPIQPKQYSNTFAGSLDATASASSSGVAQSNKLATEVVVSSSTINDSLSSQKESHNSSAVTNRLCLNSNGHNEIGACAIEISEAISLENPVLNEASVVVSQGGPETSRTVSSIVPTDGHRNANSSAEGNESSDSDTDRDVKFRALKRKAKNRKRTPGYDRETPKRQTSGKCCHICPEVSEGAVGGKPHECDDHSQLIKNQLPLGEHLKEQKGALMQEYFEMCHKLGQVILSKDNFYNYSMMVDTTSECGTGHHELQERLCLLTNHRRYTDANPPTGLTSRLPPEIWVLILGLLDDVSLWQCSRVCLSWRELVLRNWGHDHWRRFTLNRWRFFRPLYAPTYWHALYSALMESSPCQSCQVQMAQRLDCEAQVEKNSWCMRRLRNENRSLLVDPPEGIEALPLDPHSLHWQAAIRGPAGSPYMGGTFYLYILIPPGYPLCPPVVRFLTKIFHPNVSCHGDIGLDSIQHNWSLALTISKVLISIQSLLTDPYTKVCMEPQAGSLYESDRSKFEMIAREWTWRHAMTDTLQPPPTLGEMRLCEAVTGCIDDNILEPMLQDVEDEDQDNNEQDNNEQDNNEQDNNDQDNNDQDNNDQDINEQDNNEQDINDQDNNDNEQDINEQEQP